VGQEEKKGRKSIESAHHVPVLYHEVLAGLRVRPGGKYIDCTVGGGGHAQGILEALAPGGQLLGLDADPESLAHSQERLAGYGQRVRLVQANFIRLGEVAREHDFCPADGILFDLGLSSLQLASVERGFSFQQDGPLDMRFDPEAETLTAEELVNELAEGELARLIRGFGEDRRARRIARAIVEARPLRTTLELAGVVEQAVGRRGRLHPATRTFQALRIAVNAELENLHCGLGEALECLAPGGRLAVISFHSLEDRIVKRFFRREARGCICPPQVPVCTCGHRASLRVITKRPMRPSPEERLRNPRSRSARLRIAERINM